MLNDAKDLQAVYIVCGYTDLRKGIDSLSNIISQTYGMDPFQPGTLFMFCGRKTDRIKALIWEGDGFLLCYKRLEQKASKFQWPRSQEEVCKLTSQQFRCNVIKLRISILSHQQISDMFVDEIFIFAFQKDRLISV